MKRRWRQNRGKIRRRGNEGIRRKRRKNGEKWKTWRMGNKDEEQKHGMEIPILIMVPETYHTSM